MADEMLRTGLSRAQVLALVAVACLFLVAVVLLNRHQETASPQAPALREVAQSGSEELVSYLSSEDSDVVMTALSVLKGREDPAGRQKARELLQSDDNYIRLNAALYLGALSDAYAVPRLIEALRHRAQRAHGEAADYLAKITGQDFGTDYHAWARWWEERGRPSDLVAEPEDSRAWEDEQLAGEQYLINGVADPVTIRHMDAAVRLVGVQLRHGSDPGEAVRHLKMLVLNQWVEVRPDEGRLEEESGNLRAFVYWVSSGDPSLDRMLRGDLPPVPFEERTLLNAYLLRSDLYALDPDSVHNERMLDRLREVQE